MILGHGEREGKVGLIAHESFHNWYYGILGSDEFQYPWMDEGFTTYAEEIVLDSLYNHQSVNPLSRAYDTYRYYTQQPWEEPMTTPADFYHVNAAYSINSYYKGAITLSQLEYIVGKDAFATGMLRYFDEWKFKHPSPKDFLRVMELTSDMELDWYFEHWVNTTKHIDYSIDSIIDGKKKTEVILGKLGDHPMPLDIKVTLKNGEEIWYNIPLKMMLGMKDQEQKNWTMQEPWQWTNPTYQFTINAATKDIETIEIDPTGRLADVDIANNMYPADDQEQQ
jgi:aminopeptidase N